MLYPTLAPLPGVYSPRSNQRRTRAADTDEGGRRAGNGDLDADGGDQKDMLPAYDNVGGPPKYMELEMEGMGRTRIHLDLMGMGRGDGIPEYAMGAPQSPEGVASNSHSHGSLAHNESDPHLEPEPLSDTPPPPRSSSPTSDHHDS